MPALRMILAPNASALTLDGTRTYIVGRRHVAIIDPGPAAPAHLDAIAGAVGAGAVAAVLLTHDHPDHAASAAVLGERLRAPVLARRAGSLADGTRVRTDAGELVAVATPGHTTDHVAFHWAAARAIFCGDLMMGGLDTALVAPPEGDLRAYLASLERVRALHPATIYPAHGPPFKEPGRALDVYVRHREARARQVRAALEGGARTVADVVAAVYGVDLDPGLRAAATGAVAAYLESMDAEHQAAARRVLN